MFPNPDEMPENTAEERFLKRYITSGEIVRRMNTYRSRLVYLRRTERLPVPFMIEKLHCWERTPELTALLNSMITKREDAA